MINEDAFWAKVDQGGDCWEWTACLQGKGYGQIHERIGFKQYRSRLAHRVAYELVKGPIPEGLDLDHLCRNRKCVNPDHLEPVTRQENLARGVGAGETRKRWQAQTHCKRGHELAGDNIYIIPSTGSRQCLACVRGRKAAA